MKKTLALAVVIVALVAVPFAAAGSVLSAYGDQSEPVVQVKGATGSNTPTTSSSGPSTLPFTGSDLAIFMVAGFMLVGVGVGLRRLGRDKA